MRKKMSWKRAALPAALAMCAWLAACGDRVDNTETPEPPQASVEINRQGEQGAKPVTEAVGVMHDTNTMGAGPALALAPASAPGAMDQEDTRIASDVKTALAADPDFSSMKIDVFSDEGMITLRGRAPDPGARERARDIARTVRDVKSVDNQLTLG
ncbi:BON domain-containing protein [Ramlibacter sp. G-1-2-2]|uniref:BON domain-containing protein n=1 Tax=Ramlibacter agri TaxID=2728837 RepID=A0A848H3N3_9BURK|nr:BON domain-containing protein [Ramlibacter agri]NML43810.1 BON domain-containing protein [Ramlibacter agri]